jgi:HlyD family secretion protein
MTWWRGLLAGLIVLGVAGIAAAGLRVRPPPPVEVQLGTVRRAPIARTIAGAGKVQPVTTVKISSNLSGDLVELSVHEGELVKKGQLLGRIDRRRFEANARQAQAALGAARADVATTQVEVDRLVLELARVAGLVDKGLASRAESERATSDLASARSRVAALTDRAAQAAAVVDEAQNNLSKTVFVAPIDGTVIERSREVGERVRGSDFNEDVVLTLAGLASMEVKIEVGEHEVVHLRNGQKTEVKVDALEDQSFEGTVTEIAQKALVRNPGSEQETTSFPVTVGLTTRPAGVMPGMSAEVRITAEERELATLVAVQAVTVRPEKMLGDRAVAVDGTAAAAPRRTEAFAKVVFVVDQDHRAHVRRVRTGISSDTDIEILDGLKEGERIVEGPYRTLAKELREGDRVEEAVPGKGAGH